MFSPAGWEERRRCKAVSPLGSSSRQEMDIRTGPAEVDIFTVLALNFFKNTYKNSENSLFNSHYLHPNIAGSLFAHTTELARVRHEGSHAKTMPV